VARRVPTKKDNDEEREHQVTRIVKRQKELKSRADVQRARARKQRRTARSQGRKLV
jgi:hypothetical protein